MNSSKKKTASMGVIVMVSAAVGAVVGTSVVQSMFKSGSNGDVDAVLRQVAEKTNKQLPVTIDKHTRLDTTVALPDGKFQYRYTVFSVDELPNAAEFEKVMKPKLINQYQTSGDMKQVRDLNATLIYSYFLEDGTSFASFEILASDSSNGVTEDTKDP